MRTIVAFFITWLMLAGGFGWFIIRDVQRPARAECVCTPFRLPTSLDGGAP